MFIRIAHPPLLRPYQYGLFLVYFNANITITPDNTTRMNNMIFVIILQHLLFRRTCDRVILVVFRFQISTSASCLRPRALCMPSVRTMKARTSVSAAKGTKVLEKNAKVRKTCSHATYRVDIYYNYIYVLLMLLHRSYLCVKRTKCIQSPGVQFIVIVMDC